MCVFKSFGCSRTTTGGQQQTEVQSSLFYIATDASWRCTSSRSRAVSFHLRYPYVGRITRNYLTGLFQRTIRGSNWAAELFLLDIGGLWLAQNCTIARLATPPIRRTRGLTLGPGACGRPDAPERRSHLRSVSPAVRSTKHSRSQHGFHEEHGGGFAP